MWEATGRGTFKPSNALFLDDFAEDFGSISNIEIAREPTEKDNFDQSFWTKVQEAFIHSHPVHNKLQFADDDENLQGSIGINPSKTEQHDWSKLRKICKCVQKMESCKLQPQEVRDT